MKHLTIVILLVSILTVAVNANEIPKEYIWQHPVYGTNYFITGEEMPRDAAEELCTSVKAKLPTKAQSLILKKYWPEINKAIPSSVSISRFWVEGSQMSHPAGYKTQLSYNCLNLKENRFCELIMEWNIYINVICVY